MITNDLIKSLSGFLYDYDDIEANAQSRIVDAENRKIELEQLDIENTYFTDQYFDTIKFFHDELVILSGDVRTEYDKNLIESAARRLENPHWPIGSNPWVFLYPRIVNAFNGNPRNSNTSNLEIPVIEDVLFEINLILNGFNGPNGRAITSQYNGGNSVTTSSDTGGITVGDIIHIGGEAYGLVTSTSCTNPDAPATPVCTITFNLLGWSGNTVASGQTVTGNFPAHNEDQRIGVQSPSFPNLLPVLKDYMESKLNIYEQYLTDNTWPIVNDNPTTNFLPSQNAMRNYISSLRNFISSWKSLPDLDSNNSRWNNANFVTGLKGNLEDRKDVSIPNRIIELDEHLGFVDQSSSNGEYTGEGAYLDFVLAFVERTFSAGGSLNSLYTSDLGIEVAENKLKELQKKRDNTENILDMYKFTQNPEGTEVFLDSVTGLFSGQSVKIVAENQTVIEAIINAVGSPTVTLDASIPASYSVANKARLIKLN